MITYSRLVHSLNWDKKTGLLPAIIQDSDNLRVLMLGYMNKDSLKITLKTKKVTFYSRKRKNLWTKGETSKNYLNLVDLETDCDSDTLLIKAKPSGPTCHLGKQTCFNDELEDIIFFLNTFSDIIKMRIKSNNENSYTKKLFSKGKARISQKVGEECVELVIASMKEDKNEVLNESADLIFHLIILLKKLDLDFTDVIDILYERNKKIKV